MAERQQAQARSRDAQPDVEATTGSAGRRSAVPGTGGGGGGGQIFAVRDRILALREAGQASSPEGVGLIGRLMSRPGDVFAAEAFLETGVLDRNADHARWAAAIEHLSADARAAYDATIRSRGGAGLEQTLAEDRTRTTAPGETTAPADQQRTDATGSEPAPETAVAAAAEASQVPQAPASTGEYDDIAIDDFIAPSERSQSLSAIIIGNAEGTRKPGGGMTWAYGEHIDPGNSARNRGSYSLQGATHLTPAEADRTQQERMQARLPAYTAACQAAGVSPNNAIVLVTYFDQYNVKPALATEFGALLPQLAARGITHEHAIDTRIAAAQRVQPRSRWTGWEKIAREYLHKPSAQITDAEFWRVVRIVLTGRQNRMREAMTALGIRHPTGGQVGSRTGTGAGSGNRDGTGPGSRAGAGSRAGTGTGTGRTPSTPTPSTPTPSTPSPSTPTPSTQHHLHGSVGDDGDNKRADVAAVQRRLTELGFHPGPIDHLIGAHTIGAIRKYQKSIGIAPDGLVEVGKGTERHLFGTEADLHRDGTEQTPGSSTSTEQPTSGRRADGMYMVGGYPSSHPAGHVQALYSGEIVQATLPHGIVVRPGVRMSPAIVRGATALAPYLPRGVQVTSGIRTDEHQARLIVEKAGGLIHGDLWRSYLHANGGERAREVAWVGNSNHRAGLAFDLVGAPFSLIMEAIRRARLEHPEAKLHPGHVERNCIHVNVDP